MPRIRDARDDISSPYLLSHADNPVDWYSWGEDAFDEARRLDRPVFISIGYSACHWCHVMAHESFEDPVTARMLNERFVAIKVDREEHPDVDAVYMESVHALGVQGGWPLSVFTTPEGRPFFGGTYFPKVPRGHMTSFSALLEAIGDAWSDRRSTIDEQSRELTDAIGSRLSPPVPEGHTRPEAGVLLSRSVQRFAEMFDPEYGGVGGAPKFPQAPMLELMLVAHLHGDERALPMVTTSLDAMAAGGIYDHLGGGFARYSVDRQWLVPHFEKMLYDQAMLARLYLHAWQITGEARFRLVMTETIDYVLRDLRRGQSGLFCAEDADSEGEEGRFYTWTRDEVERAIGAQDAGVLFDWYGDMTHPNFEHGRSILFRPPGAETDRPDEVEQARQRLFAARAGRIRPSLDDKIITEWNAMFASMLCEAAAATGHRPWQQIAETIGEFILDAMRTDRGRLLRVYKGNRARHLALSPDYAWTVDLMTRLSELTGRARYLTFASELADEMIERFGAPGGNWYLTGDDATGLVVRPTDSYDGVTPAAGSITASALARLGTITGNVRYLERARKTLDATSVGLDASPIAFAHLVAAACVVDHGAMEIVIVGDRPDLLEAARARYLPESVLAWGEPTDSPLWEGRTDGRAYVCRGGICQLPVDDVAGLDAEIRAAASRE